MPGSDWCRKPQDIDNLSTLLGMFAYIKKLAIAYSYTNPSPHQFSHVIGEHGTTTTPSIDSIVVLMGNFQSDYASQPYDLLSRMCCLDHLRSLAIRLRNSQEVVSLGEFLRSKGSTIEHLELDFWPSEWKNSQSIGQIPLFYCLLPHC